MTEGEGMTERQWTKSVEELWCEEEAYYASLAQRCLTCGHTGRLHSPYHTAHYGGVGSACDIPACTCTAWAATPQCEPPEELLGLTRDTPAPPREVPRARHPPCVPEDAETPAATGGGSLGTAATTRPAPWWRRVWGWFWEGREY